MKHKEVKKDISFDHKNRELKNRINAYYPSNGIVQTIDSGMHFLIDEDKEKINRILEEFFKNAKFKVK